MTTENIKVQNYTEDLEMFTTELNCQKEKSKKLTEEADKIEQRYQNFTAERNVSLEALLKQELEDLLLNEKKTIMSSISKVAEPSQGSKTTNNTVFFSLKDLNEGIRPVDQIQKGREILENKVKQYLDIMDKIESTETAKDILAKNMESLQVSYTFGPFFITFYRTVLLLFVICLRLSDADDTTVGLLKTLNETLFNQQLFSQKINSWDAIAQLKSRILDFQLEMKNKLQNMIPK